MSDFEDKVITDLHHHIDRTYRDVATICAGLPIAITLPTDDGNLVIVTDAVPAITRAMALITEQPLPETQKDQFASACGLWLATVDVFAMMILKGYTTARAYSIATILGELDLRLRDLGTWFADRWLNGTE